MSLVDHVECGVAVLGAVGADCIEVFIDGGDFALDIERACLLILGGRRPCELLSGLDGCCHVVRIFSGTGTCGLGGIDYGLLEGFDVSIDHFVLGGAVVLVEGVFAAYGDCAALLDDVFPFVLVVDGPYRDRGGAVIEVE